MHLLYVKAESGAKQSHHEQSEEEDPLSII